MNPGILQKCMFKLGDISAADCRLWFMTTFSTSEAPRKWVRLPQRYKNTHSIDSWYTSFAPYTLDHALEHAFLSNLAKLELWERQLLYFYDDSLCIPKLNLCIKALSTVSATLHSSTEAKLIVLNECYILGLFNFPNLVGGCLFVTQCCLMVWILKGC